jgi:GNAT superfamily N-acetyltransferase
MRARLGYLASTFRAKGVLGVADLLWTSLFRVNVFQVFYLDLAAPFTPPAPPDDIVVRPATLDEVRALRSQDADRPVDYHCDTLFGLTLPFVAEVGGQHAAICWLVTHGQFSRFLDLAEGDLEINYLAVGSAFQGRRLGYLLMGHQIAWAKANGYRRMLTVPNVENIASLKPMLDLGFRPIEALRHVANLRPKATLAYFTRKQTRMRGNAT